MLRYFFIVLGFFLAGLLAVAGFRGQKSKEPPIEIFPDMDHQPKVKAQVPSKFFADNRGNRLPVLGTVPIGYEAPHSKADPFPDEGKYRSVRFSAGTDYFNTGRFGNQWGTGLPLPVTAELMQRGKERYQIYCAVCHGASGGGNGVAGQYGLVAIASYHQDRLRIMADGEIYNTITHGKNTMLGYGANIPVDDRWAIVAYVRALQLAQTATLDDVPAGEQAKLEALPQP
ncbi:MAG: cytochrome c [Chthoniobacterales bacterium]|jgi:mono/diheme cytochrome c family protein|nr:cytochrome c [Chthoniobacterales bacterium]